MTGETLSALYPMVGRFCLGCGAVEFELDRFVFGASELYRQRLSAEFPVWPQQAQAKQKALAFIYEDLMQWPPDPSAFGFGDFSEARDALRRLYDIRNLIFHGTPVTGGGRPRRWCFTKVARPLDGDKGYSFRVTDILQSDLEQALNSADMLVLFLDGCVAGLRRERGGWLSIDLTAGPQLIKKALIVRGQRRVGTSVPTVLGDHP